MAYADAGVCELQYVVERRMINFWLHVSQGKQSKLSHTIYLLLRKLSDKVDFQNKWILKIKNILDKCGMSNVWDMDENVNAVWVKNSVNRRLDDMATQNTFSEINRNRVCSNYKIFKQEYGIENYLVMLDFPDRRNLCRFRCGSHRLPIADRRYDDSQPIKTCPKCNTQDQADEFHYALVCPSLTGFRDMYINKYYSTRPNTLKFNQLCKAKENLLS